MKFENSERLRRAFLIRAESASTIFHSSFFILRFNMVAPMARISIFDSAGRGIVKSGGDGGNGGIAVD